MKRSDRRILTSHAGSLPRPEALLEVNRPKLTGEAYDENLMPKDYRPRSRRSAASRRKLGVDVINDGEFGKASLGAIDYGAWSSYAWARLSGWEPGEPGRLPALAGRRDRQKFAEFYAELDATSFRSSSSLGGRPPVFTGPIAYIGQQAVRADLANFKARIGQGDGGGRVHHRRRARQFRPAAEPVLRLGRGVPLRPRRGIARGIPGHCRGGVRPAARRPRTAGHLGHGQPGAERRGLPQICRIARRGA